MNIKKLFQYIRIVLVCGPVIIYYHFRYMIKFAKHTEKYSLEYRYKIIRKEITFVLSKFHLAYDIKGLDKFINSPTKALLISNHLSFFDPLFIIVNSEKPVSFVVKKETYKMPFAGKIAEALEAFPLDRENIMAQLSEIRKIVDYLKDPSKPNVVIYIEGTRNRHPENTCLDFHPGTLKIAQMAGVPLCVAATYGGFRPLSIHSYLKSYPCFFNLFDKLDVSEVKGAKTTDLAIALKEKVDNNVDKLRKLDNEFILNSKISSKVKELETRVNIRVNS